MSVQRTSYLQLTRQTQPLASTDMNIPHCRDLRNNNTVSKAASHGLPATGQNVFLIQQSFVYGNENSSGVGLYDSSQKDGNFHMVPKLTFEDAPDNILEKIDSETLLKLAKERYGMQMLKSHFPPNGSLERRRFFSTVLQQSAFNELIDHSSGNFLIQKMIEESDDSELAQIEEMLLIQLPKLCNGCYGCRVVQQMIERIQEKFPSRLGRFIGALAGHEYQLAVAQTGSHVLQKIFKCTSFEAYAFILKAFVSSTQILESIVEDKYGCRVIQLALQQLTNELSKSRNQQIEVVFNKIMEIMKGKSLYFISHQYANYIMQDLLCLEMKSLAGRSPSEILLSGSDSTKRAAITETILANLLSLSQEKHASHVVEKAFLVAPEKVLCAMMHEVFEGYECDREGNDALNVLMFDQYGNYVVQTMIDVALAVKKGHRKGKVEWYNRLVERVSMQQSRLLNFSSGKRIISKLVEAGALSQQESGNTAIPFSSIPAKFH